MSDPKVLATMSPTSILRELRNRSVKSYETSVDSNILEDFDDKTLISALKANAKVIYGVDDRRDLHEMPQGPDRDDADSVVALFRAASVIDNGNGTSTLRTVNFGVAHNLCPNEAFGPQPTGAFCSGFLVAPDIVATAGHCIDSSNVTNVRFVFGFRMRDATNAETVISNSEIYKGSAIVDDKLTPDGPDWSLVRLDRPVTNHRIAAIRRTGRIEDNQAVHVIGHPSGLPTKFAAGAKVRDNTSAAFFVANLDTYGGNSGSPVFNSATHQVEGILVRGETEPSGLSDACNDDRHFVEGRVAVNATGFFLADPAPLFGRGRPSLDFDTTDSISSTHSSSIGGARGPLSPPTIAQSMPPKFAEATEPSRGSNEMKRMAALTLRRWFIRSR